MSPTIIKIRSLLSHHHQESPILFFKTGQGQYAAHDRFLGIKVPNLRKIAKQFMSLRLEDNKVLLNSIYNEERLLALFILIQQYQKAAQAERQKLFNYYLDNIDHINNWNLVDASAHYILGAHCYVYNTTPIIELSQSKTLWAKRIAIVASFYFIKQGHLDLTFRLAKDYLNSKEDLIHKATGWMLREAGKKNPMELLDFLDNHSGFMPRTMLCYAIERLSPAQRQKYLQQKPIQ